MNDQQRPIPMNDPAWGEAWKKLRATILVMGELEPSIFTFGEECFMAGWKAREQAPNTLILDTTNAQMTPVLGGAMAAPSLPLRRSVAKSLSGDDN